MRQGPLLLLTVLAVMALTGCLKDPLAPNRDVEVAGKPDGTFRSNSALKVSLTGNGTFSTVAFDRSEWHVAGLDREFTNKVHRYVAIVGDERATRTEVIAREFRFPENLTERFRYDHLRSTHSEEELLAMDREWDTLLAKVDDGAPAVQGNATLPAPVGNATRHGAPSP